MQEVWYCVHFNVLKKVNYVQILIRPKEWTMYKFKFNLYVIHPFKHIGICGCEFSIFMWSLRQVLDDCSGTWKIFFLEINN